jgi:hypothetical protein
MVGSENTLSLIPLGRLQYGGMHYENSILAGGVYVVVLISSGSHMGGNQSYLAY